MTNELFEIPPEVTFEEHDENNPRYAGFWVRSWAVSIDGLIIFGFLLIAAIITSMFVDTGHLAARFSIWVMDFLKAKVDGLQNMPMGSPAEMENTLGTVLSKLDLSLTYMILPVQMVFSAFYYAIPESSKMQGSIGKYCMKIKIVDLNGNRIGFFRAFARDMIKLIPGSFYFIATLIIFLPVCFDKKKRGLHDRICGTYVVYK
jgi:uncharacterized RDD family membrane protein YckC